MIELGLKISLTKGFQEDKILKVLAFNDYVLHNIPVTVYILEDCFKLTFTLNGEDHSLIISQKEELVKIVPPQMKIELTNYVLLMKSLTHKSLLDYNNFFKIKPSNIFEMNYKFTDNIIGDITVKLEKFSSGIKITFHRKFVKQKLFFSSELVLKKMIA